LNVLIIFILVMFAGCGTMGENARRPNIVLIVADDLGYGDIGCYGGDIETPAIDALARHGVRFSRFHTAPMCAPTRAMLLSGNDNHLAGMGGQGSVSEVFGYEGRLMERIVPVPALLRDTGYHTYMAGKWHLGSTPEANPHQKGFERSFVLLGGAGNHYNNHSVLGSGYSRYTEDGDSATWEEGAYSTDFYTDKLIGYIESNKGDGRPFFAFAAYTSPHWPLQVDRKHWERYRGRYDDGYEKLRAKRLNSLKAAGMIPPEAMLPMVHESVVPWDSLSDEEQLTEARKMELYAGMVDNLDYNIGRLINYLKEEDLYEHTLFVFMSDNGAAYRDFINSADYQFLREYYNDDYENMGNGDSYVSYGPQWAEAGSAPFRYFKDFATEGGINTTMIITGPGVNRRNEIHHGFATLLDLAPTFYEYAGVSYPDTYGGHEVYPLKGSSLVPFLSGNSDEIHDDNYVFAIEHYGNAMVRKGSWKITNYISPFGLENFALFNLSEDLGEQHDLRDLEPEKYAEMLAEWERYAREVRLPYGSSSDE
jgi:arylsulfatase